jgi:hypothetical protein
MLPLIQREKDILCNKKINIRGNCMTGEQLKLLTKMILEIGITESLA